MMKNALPEMKIPETRKKLKRKEKVSINTEKGLGPQVLNVEIAGNILLLVFPGFQYPHLSFRIIFNTHFTYPFYLWYLSNNC